MNLCAAYNGMEFCTRDKGHDGPHIATIGPARDGGPEIARWPIAAPPEPEPCNCDQSIALQRQLDAWRTWAQFVYGGGGPVTGTDDELRTMICAQQDADLAAARAWLEPRVKVAEDKVTTAEALIAQWRETVMAIGPHLEGAAFEQCANQLDAALASER